ncbi:unnamed protein product [Rotaria magnacalcarata]|uniref:Uncharacterized protein n=4 Tax=Rotaria magnacalcarata TaxID=392030 RepID=A0A814Y7C6_9BILA|nr:unnamed protein product [Rotaria magnacalcarata]CAF3839609.1 unnamed protein product [Rotaria magnacalcarata]
MKRKRYESTTISNKILRLKNGSNVEVQLHDGKWHSGIILECQLRKYLVQVEQQQYWIELDLIRPNTIIGHKRSLPFEYRPGQFLRNETKSRNTIVSDEKVLSSFSASSSICSQNDFTKDSKQKRLSRTTSINNEEKKSPFVWKPNTNSTIQTRRSSKTNNLPLISPEENIRIDNHCRRRTLSNSTEETSNNVKTSTEAPPSEVLIFRPIIRFVEETTNDQQSNNRTSLKCNCSMDVKNEIKGEERHSNGDAYRESLINVDIINQINISNDSRSSSRTSTDNPCIINPHETNRSFIEQQMKNEQQKSSCFLETPPPSLPDINLTQESENCFDKPFQQLKSKRKQNRPQRKQIELNSQKQNEEINGFINNLFLKEQDNENLFKKVNETSDRGYLSDEYSEPISSNNHLLSLEDLENFSIYLGKNEFDKNENFNNQDDQILYEDLLKFIYNNNENYNKINKYRLEYYYNQKNQRLNLISNVLEKIFDLFHKNNFIYLFQLIPREIKTHIKLCLKNVFYKNLNKNKILTKTKRLNNIREKNRNIKMKRSSIINIRNENESLLMNGQQILLSPSSPLTCLSSKIVEQESIEELLSPNNNLINSNLIQQISFLPKERDLYEVIHCLCNLQIDNGFMIQCESCLCWSHCTCVGVTTSCIPALFKCNICTKAENECTPHWSISSMLDDETTALFLNTSIKSEKISLFLSYSRRLWNLREQIIELKLQYTPTLRSLQHSLRCDNLIELYDYANIKSDELMAKIEERENKKLYLESIAETINHILDSVCSSISSSSCCLSIELIGTSPIKTNKLNDQMNIFICHLSDDEQTRQIRLLIQNRYEHLMSLVDNKIQNILIEHQNIQAQMAFEFGIMPNNLSNNPLSYDTHELTLRTALERIRS